MIKPKKKIALCISGYLRTFKECYPSIKKNIIQDHDVDIFIHTYDKLGLSKGWKNPNTGEILNEPLTRTPASLGWVEFEPDLKEDIDLDFLKSIPNIKHVVVEKLSELKPNFSKLIGNVSIFSNIDDIAIILYKIYKCNQLKIKYEKDNNFKYDLVIRTRGDQIFTKKINLDFPRNKILVNSYPWGDEDFVNHTPGGENECLNDRFAISNSENIDYLCELYNKFDVIFKENEINYSPIEQLLKIHLNEKEIYKKDLGFYVKHNPPRIKKKTHMKKIALCISGYLRTFKECYPSIKKNIIQDHDVDIFIHTYDKLGNSSGWRHPIDLSEEIDMDFLESIPNVKVIVTEKWDDIKYKFEKYRELQPNVTNINVISTVFYKIYQANLIRKQYEIEHEINYDLVIRMRGDQVFEKAINLDFPEDKILINAYPWGDEDYVHRFKGDDNERNEEEWINDRFAVGKPELIDYLSELHLNFSELIKDSYTVELEYLLHKHLQQRQIQYEKRNLYFYVKHKPPRLIKPE